MPIDALGDIEPQIDPAAFVHPDAVIIGSVPCRVRSLTAPAGWIDSPMRAYLESARRYRTELRRIG